VKLSQNFSLRELTKSQTAERKGISNEPSEEHIENLKLLCNNVLQKVRDQFGVVSISSGYRSPELCEALGSKSTSQHARGQAADFECYGVDNNELFNWVIGNVEFDQAILEFYDGDPESGWLHVSYNEDNNRGETLRAYRNENNKVIYEKI
jgi:zinc D-Ala-D-Ala carboxypeptidase